MTTPCVGSYRIGDITKTGETISLIHGQSLNVLVFEDANGRTGWETETTTSHEHDTKIHDEFNRLFSRCGVIKSVARKDRLTGELCRALFRALCESELPAAVGHFGGVEARIGQEAMFAARVIYATSGCVVALLLWVLVGIVAYWYSAHETVTVLVLAAGAGSVGAWVSVMQRARKLTVRPFEEPYYLAFQGGSRIVLGAVFGAFMVVAVKAGLAFSILADTSWGLSAGAFIGGASERLVPELLDGKGDGALLGGPPPRAV